MKSFLYETAKVKLVPEIADDTLLIMAYKIKPLLRVGHEYYEVRQVNHTVDNLTNRSYLWDAQPGNRVGVFHPLNQLKIITFHSYGAPVLFKPSIREVMACINQFVDGWRPIKYFWLDSDTMGPEHVIGNYHWCHCHLFGEPVKEE
jgi:hypothetical protein